MWVTQRNLQLCVAYYARRPRAAPRSATTPKTSEMTAFQPAKDKPHSAGKRKFAVVHETMRMLSSWSRRLPVVVVAAPVALQSEGPGHQLHSAPAW